jgi:hypothetical protein
MVAGVSLPKVKEISGGAGGVATFSGGGPPEPPRVDQTLMVVI